MSCTDQKSVYESQCDISANDSWCNFFYYLRYSEGFFFLRKFFSQNFRNCFLLGIFNKNLSLPILLPQPTIWQLLNSYFHCATFLHLTANNYSTTFFSNIYSIKARTILFATRYFLFSCKRNQPRRL